MNSLSDELEPTQYCKFEGTTIPAVCLQVIGICISILILLVQRPLYRRILNQPSVQSHVRFVYQVIKLSLVAFILKHSINIIVFWILRSYEEGTGAGFNQNHFLSPQIIQGISFLFVLLHNVGAFLINTVLFLVPYEWIKNILITLQWEELTNQKKLIRNLLFHFNIKIVGCFKIVRWANMPFLIVAAIFVMISVQSQGIPKISLIVFTVDLGFIMLMYLQGMAVLIIFASTISSSIDIKMIFWPYFYLAILGAIRLWSNIEWSHLNLNPDKFCISGPSVNLWWMIIVMSYRIASTLIPLIFIPALYLQFRELPEETAAPGVGDQVSSERQASLVESRSSGGEGSTIQ